MFALVKATAHIQTQFKGDLLYFKLITDSYFCSKAIKYFFMSIIAILHRSKNTDGHEILLRFFLGQTCRH